MNEGSGKFEAITGPSEMDRFDIGAAVVKTAIDVKMMASE